MSESRPIICPTDNPSLSREELEQLYLSVNEVGARHRRSLLTRYNPYDKQREFHEQGALHRERCLMSANQVGKTYSGAAEVAIHLTGRYPDWWSGRRWDRPVRAWAGSQTGDVTRDGIQRLLLGEPKDESQWGEGMIPGDSIVSWSRKTGVPNALDSVTVKHVSGGKSTLGFKSYDAGRTKWVGETLDLVWFDEEPDLEIYTEGLRASRKIPLPRGQQIRFKESL